MNKKITLFFVVGILVITIVGGGYYVFLLQNDKKITEITQQTISDFNDNDLDSAITKAQLLSENDKTKIEGLLLLANSYAQKGSLEFEEKEYGDKAILTAQEVLKIDPQNVEAYGIIGYANEIEQNYEQALENYNKALLLNPNNAFVLSNRAHMYFLQGKYEEALKDYSLALTNNPSFDKALLGKAGVYARLGNFTEAEPLLNQVLLVTENKRFKAEAEDTLGVIDIKRSDYQNSLVHFDNAINYDDNFAIPLVNRAEARLGTLKNIDSSKYREVFDKILSDVQQAIDINPHQTVAYVVFGKTVYLLKDFVSAQKLFKQASELVDTDITLNSTEKTDMKKQINEWTSLIKTQQS